MLTFYNWAKKLQTFLQASTLLKKKKYYLGQLTSISSLILWSELIWSRPCNQNYKKINNINAHKLLY